MGVPLRFRKKFCFKVPVDEPPCPTFVLCIMSCTVLVLHKNELGINKVGIVFHYFLFICYRDILIIPVILETMVRNVQQIGVRCSNKRFSGTAVQALRKSQPKKPLSRRGRQQNMILSTNPKAQKSQIYRMFQSDFEKEAIACIQAELKRGCKPPRRTLVKPPAGKKYRRPQVGQCCLFVPRSKSWNKLKVPQKGFVVQIRFGYSWQWAIVDTNRKKFSLSARNRRYQDLIAVPLKDAWKNQ